MSKILTVSGLSVGFNSHQVIHDLSFDLDRGENLAVIGPNGSGKTVLLKCLLGLIPYQGTVAWDEDVKLGYVPQKIDADRHLPLSLQNLLEAKANALRLPESEVRSVIATVGLQASLLNSPIGQLSGGQFQKALIAFALLGQPNVILFDEPTASLDQLAEEHVYDLIHDLQEKQNLTIILVSHELSVVYRYATKVLCLNKQKVCFGAPKEALTTEVLAQLYETRPHYHHHEENDQHHDH